MIVKSARQIREGDWIVCPTHGDVEQVRMARWLGATGRYFIRVNGHEHTPRSDELIEIVEGKTP